MCNRAVEYVAAAAWRVVLYVGDEVANDKGMDETGQGSLHEACCIIMATIANCVLNSINKVGGIRLHEAEARVIKLLNILEISQKRPTASFQASRQLLQGRKGQNQQLRQVGIGHLRRR